MKRIPLGVLNIFAIPHREDGSTYISLFEAAYALNVIVKVRGDEGAILASCVQIDPRTPLLGLTGEIHKFTEIGEDWENLQTRKAATEADVSSMNLSPHLKPNREAFRYFLFAKEHRFVFQLRGEKRSISYKSVQKLLETLFATQEIKDHFQEVSVVAEQEPESLRQILELPQLNTLSVHVKRPNAGDTVDEEEIRQVESDLESQGAKCRCLCPRLSEQTARLWIGRTD